MEELPTLLSSICFFLRPERIIIPGGEEMVVCGEAGWAIVVLPFFLVDFGIAMVGL